MPKPQPSTPTPIATRARRSQYLDDSCITCGWHLSSASANLSALPNAFVWTRMQAESGQLLANIVRRKELERLAGAGQFWWGIGSALGDPLVRLLNRNAVPEVLFSTMRSKPRRADTAPGTVLLWTAYLNAAGQPVSLPPHALITSRGTTAGGDKRRHYALVCRSNGPLALKKLGLLTAAHFRNLGSAAPGVGASQVTAIVEHAGDGESAGPQYEINMRAELDRPYFVRLARPVILANEGREAIDSLAERSAPDWIRLVSDIRARAERARGAPDDLFSLPG